MPTKVYDKDKIYIFACPTCVKNEHVDSGKSNDYTTLPTGDAHCRGVKIVVNTTFTAGGLSAPIFVVVYGLSAKEMPNNELVTVAVPGLAVGSDHDLYQSKEVYLTFVRGN